MAKAKKRGRAAPKAAPKAPGKPGQKPHLPTPEIAGQVKTMAGMGLPADKIALVLSISETTLKKYYPRALAVGGIEATIAVAGFLFASAKKGSVAAQIFWLKTRGGWKEQPVEVDHSGVVGSYDLSKLSDKELQIAKAIALRARDSAGGVDSGGGGEAGEA